MCAESAVGPSRQTAAATYVEGELGTAEVAALDVEGASDLPLLVGLLDLASSTDVDSPAIFIDGLALGVEGHLVVGKGVGGGAVAVVDLQLADGLLGLVSGEVVTDRLLDLSLHVQVLQAH